MVASGMLFASLQLVEVGWLLLSQVVLLGCIFIEYARQGLRSFDVYACLFLVSALYFSLRAPVSSGLEAEIERRGVVELIGRVQQPSIFYAYSERNSGVSAFPVEVEGVGRSGVWTRYHGGVDVRVMNADEQFAACCGERLLLRGRLSFSDYPGSNGYTLKVYHSKEVRLLSGNAFSWLQQVGQRWRRAASARLAVGLEAFPVQRSILNALVLGYRNQVPKEVLQQFKRTGAMHIFAISGLHVGIVGVLLISFLKVVGVSRNRIVVWLLPLLVMYVISTGMKASALRALAMAAVYLFAPLAGRKPDVPSSVALAALLLLLMNPMQIVSVGFIFSFVVVIFLVMFFSVVPEACLKGNWLKQHVVSLLICSFAAGLASMPIAALYFGGISPVAFWGNLVVVPLTFGIVLCGWLSILVPLVSEVFNYASLALIDGMTGCVAVLEQAPHAFLRVGSPPIVAVMLWYGSLIYLFTHAESRMQRMYALGLVGCALLLAFMA